MKQLALSVIHGYKKIEPIRQFFMSTFIGQGKFECMYQPTCSEYAEQAILKHGAAKGTWLAAMRFLKCRPGSKGGYDPVV